MKKSAARIMIIALSAGLLGGCEKTSEAETVWESETTEGAETESAQAQTETAILQNSGDLFTERDLDASYNRTDAVQIELNGDSITASSDSVQISGTTAVITEEATYVISGMLNDGMIVVDAPETAKLQLVLNGAEINSGTSAALYILEADKVFVTLADGSENSLANGGTFVPVDENNIDAALFSKQDLTLNGTGSLTVTSPAGHGIVSKDDLVITGGSYTIASASHGLQANDSVRVTGETSLAIDAGKDGIHAENDEDTSLGFVYIAAGTVAIEAEGDGISAGAYLQVADGKFQILAGGGSENGSQEASEEWGRFGGGRPDQQQSAEVESDESGTSMKGLKAEAGMWIVGGTFEIDAADDAVHSNASVTVGGGIFYISSGDDAFHADETLTVTAGTIRIAESYEGLEALHVKIQGGDITVTASDDGLNAAGGVDESGMTGGRDGMFGDGFSGRGGGRGGSVFASSDGSIEISGGTLYINASGDGIDANGTLTISGGDTVVVGPTQGDTATLDYDVSAEITGGTFIGTGASGMAQTFSNSQQGVIAVSVGTQEAETEIVLTDQSGNEVLSFSPELPFSVVILSSPELVSGETYTISVGKLSGEVEAN